MSHVYRTRKILDQQTVSNGSTEYVELNTQDAALTSLFIRWFDSTSSATLTVESTNLPKDLAPSDSPGDEAAEDSTTATEWYEEPGISITGPAGAAAGCEMVHIGNNGARRMRLKIVAAADTDIEVWGHWKG